MKLYNTLTKKLDDIAPLNPPEVTIYTCGPTVYDYPHIGNWFTFIRYDLLVRALKASGLQPKWVMNITDVGHLVSDADEGEDKLEKGARREGKTAWDVAKFYGDYFTEGLRRLNITPPDYLPKATEHIQEQIDLIKKLEEKGYAYTISDGVYFDTSKFEGYANFAQLDVDDLLAGARVEVNPEKRSPTDFALWKFSPTDHQRDMEWASPWGKGFPGWHIECSAMSMKYLGDSLDIHSGGIDHIPVHHTNEIAQSVAATGKRFAEVWMHTNHILIEDQKISKSLGNTITLEDIEAKGYSLEALRLLVLQSHYRTQSKFSWDTLEAAQNRLKNYRQLADLQWQTITGKPARASDSFKQTVQEIYTYMENDLNSSLALAILSAFSDILKDELISDANLNDLQKFLQRIDDIFGLRLSDSEDIKQQQKDLVAEREEARKNKDWARSDELRGRLEEQGIGLRDTANGAVWYRLY